MVNKIKRFLPWVAVVSALLVLAGLVLVSNLRQVSLVDSGETQAVVDQAFAQLQESHPSSIDNPAFLSAVKTFQKGSYVVYVWLIAPNGDIVYVTSPASTSETIQQEATAETRRILASIPSGQLSADQELMLLTASAIQAEGEHNDVFGHIVRIIQAPDGKMAGLIGVAYDISPSIGGPGALYIASLLVLLVALGIYWLSLPLWVFMDARPRGEKAWEWAMFVLIGNLVALIAYILVRAPRAKISAEI